MPPPPDVLKKMLESGEFPPLLPPAESATQQASESPATAAPAAAVTAPADMGYEEISDDDDLDDIIGQQDISEPDEGDTTQAGR